ncbi:unnamed protein product [Orchesella dallaii]|uniref:C2H2-type domain-containing protein n=1 Tax=Orchesella dallaii TaxID=48710 RepID=A0ABP1RHJ1_9HEXA
MDPENRRNLICFICCKPVYHPHHPLISSEVVGDDNYEGLSSSTSFKTYFEFVDFAQRYLQLETNEGGPNNHEESTKGEVFCEPCLFLVNKIFGLYEQLCEVELRLSSKLGELGRLMKESQGHAGVKGKLGIRELIASKCLEKDRKILKATGSDGRGNESNTGEKNSLLMNEEDDDDEIGVEVKMEEGDSTDEQNVEVDNADEEEVEVDGEEISTNTKQTEDPLSLPLIPSTSSKSPDVIMSDEDDDSNSNYVPDSQSDWDESDTSDDDDTKHHTKSKRKRIVLSDVLKVMTSQVNQENELLESQVPDTLQVAKHDQDSVDCSAAISGESADEDDTANATISSDNFACDHCYRYFYTAQAIYTHLLWHESQSKEQGTPCPFCYKKFVLIQSQKLHMQIHHPSLVEVDKPFNCDEKRCVSSFKTISELSEHIVKHSKPSFHCSVCHWGFVDSHHLKVHETIHIEPKNGMYHCADCKCGFQRVKELQIHFDFKHGPSLSLELMNIHVEKFETRKTLCRYCKASFPIGKDLALHFKQCAKNPENLIRQRTACGRVMKRKRIVRCHQCGKWISQNLQKNHMAMHLQKEKMKKKRQEENCSEFSDDEDESNQFGKESNQKFTCSQCQREFSQASSLYTHLKYHDKQSGEQGTPCCFCSRTSVLSQTQQLHMQVKHPSIMSTENPYKCDENGCNSSFETVSKLNEHVTTHSKPFLHCSVCQWRFLNGDHLQLHELLHIRPKQAEYQCPSCESKYRTRQDLQIHFDINHGANLGIEFYKCSKPNCTQSFRTKRGLKNHLNNHEMGPKKNQCPHCKKTFRIDQEFITHSKICTRNPDNYILMTTSGGKTVKKVRCVICDTFVLQTSMRIHLPTHMSKEEREKEREKRRKARKGNQRLICESCGLSFINRQSLKNHVDLLHKQIIPRAECQFCEKSYQRQYELKRHVDKVHKGVDLKVICDICGKVFADKKYLQAHERLHKDERKCACHLCDKRFNFRGDLRKHLRRIHGKSKGDEFTPGEGLALKAVCMFPSCGARFGREAELQQHVEENHCPVEDNSIVMCTLCGRVFANQGRLATHNLIHPKERVH